MTDTPENHTLRLLQLIRDEQAEFKAQIATLAASIVGLRRDYASLRDDVQAIAVDVKAIKTDMHIMAIAIDGHSLRLESIKRHLGLGANKH